MEMEALRAPDDEKGLADFLTMCDWSCRQSEPTHTSGLIEQQRFFTDLTT